MLIGVISDTHGLLRPEAIDALQGCEHIIHAGDIGAPEIVASLQQIAPVYAIRGNVDTGAWARVFPETLQLEFASTRIYVLHDLKSLTMDPRASGVNVVISGHSHVPRQEWREGALYLNPGSAGKRRFRLPITLARMRIENELVNTEIVPLA
ncbi:MAG TPA: metallophosphoesterase family protein [Terriglobales bacterium]|jgi:putative phosphoesterase